MSVFACVPGGKRPLPGGCGFLDATTELARVESWWRRFPDANLAVPTGRVSGFVAVDVDVHAANGFDTFRRARDVGLLLRPLAVVRTPSGGMHLYYPADPGMEQRSWQVVRAGIDFRGGGYIITPPSSVRVDGVVRAYEVVDLDADAVESVDAAGLQGFLDPQPVARPRVHRPELSRVDAVKRIASWVGTLIEGERNRGLFWAACRLAEHGLTSNDTFDALCDPAQSVGLTQREVAVTVIGPPRSGKGLHVVIPAILDAPGAVVCTSTRPDNLTTTMRVRAKIGPVAIFDPQHLAEGLPVGLRWSPIRGCENPQTAMIRATGLAAGTGLSAGGVDSGGFWEGKTRAALQALLYAAAIDHRSPAELFRWTLDPVAAADAVATLNAAPNEATCSTSAANCSRPTTREPSPSTCSKPNRSASAGGSRSWTCRSRLGIWNTNGPKPIWTTA